jgi:hypothetical protein
VRDVLIMSSSNVPPNSDLIKRSTEARVAVWSSTGWFIDMDRTSHADSYELWHQTGDTAA